MFYDPIRDMPIYPDSFVQWADLHLHSSCSDGKESPAQLAKLASQKGLKIVSLTDHNSVKGLEEFTQEAWKRNLDVVNGVELSTRYNLSKKFASTNVHLLAYGFDQNKPDIENMLKKGRERILGKLFEIIEEVNKKFSPRGYRPVSDYFIHRLTHGREPVALRSIANEFYRVNIDKGVSPRKFENKYLSKFHYRSTYLELSYVADTIRSVGGIPVIAHPDITMRGVKQDDYYRNPAKARYWLDSLKEHVEGVEVYHSTLIGDRHIRNFLSNIAEDNDWITTVGSDHHGGKRDFIGECFHPKSVYESILPYIRLRENSEQTAGNNRIQYEIKGK